MTPEEQRLDESRQHTKHWKRWGPYLSERQWGTVREDYSPNGTAWEYFPHDMARSRAYRWGEDGIGGISDRHQRLCFALALWNGRDPILKERLFGLTGNQGNHGEDVKECYYYLDSTPTHSYMKFLYKYPQAAFPYEQLVEENGKRGKRDPEFELMDTGIFNDNRYFDVFIEYAKAAPEEILIKITAWNRGPEEAALDLLPTLWFRNIWSFGEKHGHPKLWRVPDSAGAAVVAAQESRYGERWWLAEGAPEMLFTENETNFQRVFGYATATKFVKDSFHDYLIHGAKDAVNPSQFGTKCAAHYHAQIAPGGSATFRLLLTNVEPKAGAANPFETDFEKTLDLRRGEANQFYARRFPQERSEDAHNVMRQALAGMLWSKQCYHYDVRTWLEGDPGQPPPPAERKKGRNHDWAHLYNADVLSMPDKWEYPWFAAWDLAFHTIALSLVDPDFAKDQLILLLREWYMHPNGQLPAYEWAFGDVNPPVHAWAAWRVYKIEKRIRGRADREFLQRVFHKLLLNFTWWVNRKDPDGMNVFQGGFLGLDNIGVFDRSQPLPTGGHLEQSDGTSWMGMYCLNMLAIALELAREDPAYEDVASKFFEHFVYIASAINSHGIDGAALWDEDDGFFYDAIHMPNGAQQSLKVRSLVGLIPLFAVETLEPELIARLPGFQRRMQWFLDNMPGFVSRVDCSQTSPNGCRRLLSLVDRTQLVRILGRMVDRDEFYSPHGIRALSKYHAEHPYVLQVDGMERRVDYEPGESQSSLFGGNSNWRGPIWFPTNFLMIESLQKFHHYYGDDFKVECPAGSGKQMSLWDVSAELSRSLTHIFLRDENGRRPLHGSVEKYQNDPYWRDLILFYEYFHGDTGAGLGASHQTGWTGLVSKLLEQTGE
ncbi:MAG: glucosidase [Acidobacteriia bacterium]|nr:glucosidase [Terriglobia bacterium]